MKSFIPWIGGKSLLAKTIIGMFPKDFDRYIEVFGGAGWVLFGRDKHANLEVYNDAEGQLVNLFRCIKYHAEAVQHEIDGYLNAREFFEDIKAQIDMQGLTDIQRAARFFLQIRMSYGADRRTYGCSKKNLVSTTDYLTSVKERLNGVVIEHKDFENLIKVYDRDKALFYLDPPYHGTEKHYNVGFNEADHERLKQCLNGIKGRFILSYNDDEYIRNLYKDFNIHEVERANNLSSGQYKELIITNY